MANGQLLFLALRKCFICACMDVTTQLELCLYEQTQIVAKMLPVEWVANSFLAR